MIKRKKYLISKKIQLRYTIETTIFVTVVLFVVGVDLIILQNAGNSLAITAANPGSTLEMMYLVFKKEWMLLVPMYGLTFVLVYFIPIYYSHRFVGPVQKVTSTLHSMAAGVMVNSIKFRKTDYFKELEQAINETSGVYRQTIEDLKNATDNISEKAKSLNNAELSAEVEALEKILDRFHKEEKEKTSASQEENVEVPVANT